MEFVSKFPALRPRSHVPRPGRDCQELPQASQPVLESSVPQTQRMTLNNVSEVRSVFPNLTDTCELQYFRNSVGIRSTLTRTKEHITVLLICTRFSYPPLNPSNQTHPPPKKRCLLGLWGHMPLPHWLSLWTAIPSCFFSGPLLPQITSHGICSFKPLIIIPALRSGSPGTTGWNSWMRSSQTLDVTPSS